MAHQHDDDGDDYDQLDHSSVSSTGSIGFSGARPTRPLSPMVMFCLHGFGKGYPIRLNFITLILKLKFRFSMNS